MEEEIDVVQEAAGQTRKDMKCSSPLSVSFGNADELLIMLKQFRSGLVVVRELCFVFLISTQWEYY